MDGARLIYWALAYTAGIVALTLLLLAQHRSGQRMDRQLSAFFASLTVATIGLTLMEISSQQGLLGNLPGFVALLGAAFCVSTFPLFATFSNPIGSRLAIARALRWYGVALGALDLVDFLFLRSGHGLVLALNMVSVSLAIALGFVWLLTKRRPVPGSNGNAWIKLLVLGFPLVSILDLLRIAFGFFPILGNHFISFPAYYFLLSALLAVNYALPRLGEAAHSASPPRREDDRTATNREAFSISGRESEVLEMLRRGLTYQEIAEKLFISHATVKTHVSHLYQKTNTRNKIALMRVLDSHQPKG